FRCFGIDEISAETLAQAAAELAQLQAQGRLGLLRDTARLDHVQIDNFRYACTADPEDAGFFLTDISVWDLCSGLPGVGSLARVEDAAGAEVRTIDGLRDAIHAIFDKHATRAIAVKSQHAYNRRLSWAHRDDAAAAKALEHVRAQRASEEERECLG